MEFGVFDHLDRAGTPLPEYFEDRLKIVEAYDRAGFYGYHIAEHHSTPLGMGPSPNIFLAAVAQRTRRLRFGPMVYVVALYHPVRLIAEICMLDQMSGGRLEMSFGRGASPIELEYFGADPAQAQDVYNEAVEVILRGLTHKTLDFHGKHFDFDNVPMELEPLQKPHPPIWYGAHAPDSAARAGGQSLNLINLAPTAPAAMKLAARAYRPWFDSFIHLSRLHGRKQTHPRPEEFESLMARGQGIAGSPKTVREMLAAQIEDTGCNYVVGQFTFGDMTLAESLDSIGLFVDEVIPALRATEQRIPDAVQRAAVRR